MLREKDVFNNIGAPFEFFSLALLKYIGACGSIYNALKHGIFLGISGGSFVSYSNTIINSFFIIPANVLMLTVFMIFSCVNCFRLCECLKKDVLAQLGSKVCAEFNKIEFHTLSSL